MTPQEYLAREQEIQEAKKVYPGVEIGEAYRRWKEAKGEVATMLQTSDESIEKARKGIIESAWKPCAKCGGKAILESVCGGCVEGKKGNKSKFTCEDCLHRELSKEDTTWWLMKLSLQPKVLSLPSASPEPPEVGGSSTNPVIS